MPDFEGRKLPIVRSFDFGIWQALFYKTVNFLAGKRGTFLIFSEEILRYFGKLLAAAAAEPPF